MYIMYLDHKQTNEELAIFAMITLILEQTNKL